MINLKEIEFKILLWMQYCRLWVHSTAASWRKNNKPWKGAKGENEGRWWTSLRLALSFSRDKWLAVEKRFRLASSLNSLVLRRGDDRRRRSYEDSTLSFFSTLSLSISLCPSLSILFPLWELSISRLAAGDLWWRESFNTEIGGNCFVPENDLDSFRWNWVSFIFSV